MDWSKKIVQIMNTNAKVKEARYWQAVTSKEMKVFLALLIISNGLVVLCRMSSIFYLPKLHIQPFDGNPIEWLTFWDS